MAEHLQHFIGKSVENEHNRVAFRKTTETHLMATYQKCT
jgi:hypothetical protein